MLCCLDCGTRSNKRPLLWFQILHYNNCLRNYNVSSFSIASRVCLGKSEKVQGHCRFVSAISKVNRGCVRYRVSPDPWTVVQATGDVRIKMSRAQRDNLHRPRQRAIGTAVYVPSQNLPCPVQSSGPYSALGVGGKEWVAGERGAKAGHRALQ